ncbi:hypothetical protein EHS25_007198 [Saitozyma podzolica]|uniref:Uncharacterized protein n=1 Tax=Saitozyma podzolica TaxID=1890683 RepID=A0A427XN00_9TREE|nr:hypothetical protein EHS25_007198 [Saitozyma podzolica]
MSPTAFKSSRSSLITNETEATSVRSALLSLVCHVSHSFFFSGVMALPEVVSEVSGIAEPARALVASTVPVAPGAPLIHLARFRSSPNASAGFHESVCYKGNSNAVSQHAGRGIVYEVRDVGGSNGSRRSEGVYMVETEKMRQSDC